MTIINVISAIVILTLFIFYIFRRVVSQMNKIPVELFAEALRNENSGYFEMALFNYERALKEIKTNGFIGSGLKSSIIAKLKILHMVIEYKNGFHSGR